MPAPGLIWVSSHWGGLAAVWIPEYRATKGLSQDGQDHGWLSDDVSALLSKHARHVGVSRARWVRELVLTLLAQLEEQATADDHERRITRLEARLGIKRASSPRQPS